MDAKVTKLEGKDLSFSGDLYPESGASVVMTTKGDLVRYDSQRERYWIGSANQILQVKSNLPLILFIMFSQIL